MEDKPDIMEDLKSAVNSKTPKKEKLLIKQRLLEWKMTLNFQNTLHPRIDAAVDDINNSLENHKGLKYVLFWPLVVAILGGVIVLVTWDSIKSQEQKENMLQPETQERKIQPTPNQPLLHKT